MHDRGVATEIVRKQEGTEKKDNESQDNQLCITIIVYKAIMVKTEKSNIFTDVEMPQLS